jgi:lysozyme
MSVSKKGAAAGAGAIACCVVFTPVWEGTDLTAKVDRIGTGNPITYCHGMTNADGGAVKVGQKFTAPQCDLLLSKALQRYWDGIAPCIKVDLAVKTSGSLLDAALNAGSAAVCRSPMLARMNAGDIKGGCEAFSGWYVTTKNNGQRKVIKGLVNRRNGDSRKGEKELCLEGLTDPAPAPDAPVSFWTSIFKLFFKGA